MSIHSDPRDHRAGPVTSAEAAAAFRDAFMGRFTGLLAWEDVTAVFERVGAAPSCWWVYDTRGDVPVAPEEPALVAGRLADIAQFLRRHHKADYCGFVYVDDKTAPALIKVFDPRNASSCSLGTPVPVYTVSRLRPVTLPFEAAGPTAAGKGGTGKSGGFLGRIIKGWS